MKVKIEGNSKVNWSPSISKVYYDNMDHFNTEIVLREPDQGNDKITIDSGLHTFEIKFNIPSDCPTSFESWKGRTRYLVKVVYVKQLLNNTKTFAFTVVNPLDLNTYAFDLEVSMREDYKCLILNETLLPATVFHKINQEAMVWIDQEQHNCEGYYS